MYFTPTIFIVQLLAAMQVLMTLDMPLSTTMALPVTSKPIESTVENLAWQAWIELPPEQKQQVKSRKVTPKSIFTLPLRVECPQGHKQVDSKCIPIAIGSNDVLIDLNALGLLVGNTHTDDIYDYDDMGDEEMGSSLPYASDMPPGIEADKSMEGITVELKPPSKDEPLKFNIFENKFNIFHEEPMEDYSALSNEGLQSAEKDQTTKNETLMGAVNVNATTINDLLSESSNISENNFEIYVQKLNGSQVNASSYDKVDAINTLTTLANEEEFKIDAISVPAAGFDNQNSKILSVIQNDTSIQLVTNIMDTEPTTATKEHKQEVQENDLQTLLQTESFLPLMQQATATTLLDHGKLNETASLTTVQDQETSESTVDNLKLNIDEEMTTLPNLMDSDLEKEKAKQEFTRSVTMLPLIANESDNDNDDDKVNSDNENNDVVNETTLATETNDEPLETTTPIQLDDTTIIETSLSSLSTTPATQKQQQMELKELLMQQEQTQKDFEELQRMRKGQKDQKQQQQQQQQQQHHIILKKSKVEPVELVANTKATLTDTKITNNILTLETSTLRSSEELSTATASSSSSSSSIALTAAQTDETVTPLLTVHNNENNNNNNNNNDRFYYQHFGKQDSEETQSQQLSTAATSQSFTQTTELETMPLTSEIDLAEELRLINELVKGIKPATTLTTIKTMQTSTTSTTTTTTTEKPLTKEESQSTTVSSTDVASESSLVDNIKTTPSTAQIWSKIMPLLTTSTTQATPKQISERSSIEGQESNDIPTTATTTNSLTSPRSNRNSKIIRLNNFNTVAARKIKPLSESSTSTTTTTTTAATQLEDEESTSSSSSSSGSSSDTPTSATENNTYEPYWWLPVAWRFDKPTSSTSEKPLESVDEVKTEEQPLLLRFWSAYHAPKSSS